MFNYGNANEAQKEAISATDGLVLITAGPASMVTVACSTTKQPSKLESYYFKFLYL